MLFTTDKQTTGDLSVFGRKGEISLFSYFNHTYTQAGEHLLEQFFNEPLSTATAINRRSDIIAYFAAADFEFPLKNIQLNTIESYLENSDPRTRLSSMEGSISERITGMLGGSIDADAIYNGISELVRMIRVLAGFLSSLALPTDHPYISEAEEMHKILNEHEMVDLINKFSLRMPKKSESVALDDLFRFGKGSQLKKLFGYIAAMDVYCSIALVARKNRLCFTSAKEKSTLNVEIKGLVHPFVEGAIPNSVSIDPGSHIIFLTGANMAGKSTFMKALSTALYLAHMGFPIAAESMTFSVLDGIYTTINLPDNLGMGASHFYSEILRAKKIALELQDRKLFVLFDELFRGTNVKDALEATIAFSEAFTTRPDCIFVLSTHIIEAGEVLQKSTKGIQFLYLPTEIEGGKPKYSYKLKEGISSDRHGMIIINNEGILDILNQGLTKLALK